MTDREADKLADKAASTKPSPGRLGRDVQSKIGQQLRSMYDDVVSGGKPDRFSEMLEQLDHDAQSRQRSERIENIARETFGDEDFAQRWLMLPNPALRNRIPIEVAATDAGVHEVLAILSRIAHGDYT